MPDLKVVPLFDQAVASDVIGSLRRAATSIEKKTEEDDRTQAMIAVQITENGRVEVYGWGRTDMFHAMGALAAAITKISPA